MYWKIVFITSVLTILTTGEPIVQLPTGQILGRTATTIENISYYAFEGVPYAAPPVGSLRFKAPQSVDSWNGVLNSTHSEITCFQTTENTETESEDCLFLNIFTPQLPNDDIVPIPVLLFFYGGGFINGYTQNYPPDLFVNNGVILVTVSYRVGVFGFLSTQDAIIPGNNGLKDQQFAIQWTHDNIHLFGGDSNKITILGQSAGSASVSYQLLNRNNEGLFQGAILESGTFLNPWAFQRRARKIAFETAALLDSSFQSSNDSEALLNFLQTVDARDLDAAAENIDNIENRPDKLEIFQGFSYAPVIEIDNPDAFVSEKMFGLLLDGNILKVPTIIGINSEEGLRTYPDTVELEMYLLLFDEHLDWMVPDDMQIVENSSRVEMGRSIRKIYTGDEAIANYLGDGIKFSSDNAISRSVIKFAELYSQISKTYFYQFSYDGELGNNTVHYDGAEYVCHGEELQYLFCSGTHCDDSSYAEGDRITRKRLLQLWTDFAKYQNPTPEISVLLQNITWPVLETGNGNYYYLDINENLEIKNHPKEDAYKGWTDLYDSLGYSDFDTY